jgi:hypothetical protein
MVRHRPTRTGKPSPSGRRGRTHCFENPENNMLPRQSSGSSPKVRREALRGRKKADMSPRTTRPAMVTTSVYSSPLTVEFSKPSSYTSVKFFPRSREVKLADGSYSLCPEQDELQFFEATKRSLPPVLRSTEYETGSDDQFRTGDSNVLPVKFLGGVPIEMVPYHKKLLSSIKGTLPGGMFNVLIPPARGCCFPVFF